MKQKLHLLLAFAFLIAGACFAGRAFVASGGVADRLFLLFCALILGCAGGYCLIRSLPMLAERFACGLVLPRRFLSKAPLILGPVEGLLRAGKLAEAEERLLSLTGNCWEDPAAAALYLCILEKKADRGKTLDFLRGYFRQPCRRKHPENVFLLLRLADLLTAEGMAHEAAEILSRERQNRCYTALEKERLAAREGFLRSRERKGETVHHDF